MGNNQKIENKNQNEKMLRNAILALAATIATTTSARMLKDKDGQDSNEDYVFDTITEDVYRAGICSFLCVSYTQHIDPDGFHAEYRSIVNHFTSKLIEEQ